MRRMLPGWRRTRTGASNLILPINIRKWQERKGAKNGQGRKTCAIARSYCAQLICEKKEVRVKIKSSMLVCLRRGFSEPRPIGSGGQTRAKPLPIGRGSDEA